MRDNVYLRVNPRKITLRMGTCPSLPPRFSGSSEILEALGHATYQLTLTSHIKVDNFFHVSLLKKYVHDGSHIID